MKEELVATFLSEGCISCNILKFTFQPLSNHYWEFSMIRHENAKETDTRQSSHGVQTAKKQGVEFPNAEYQI